MAGRQGHGLFCNQHIHQNLLFEPLPLPHHDCPLPNKTCKYPIGEHKGHEHKEDRAFFSRVERFAKDYLDGKPLFIQSASLHGPFDSTWINPWVLQNQQITAVRNHRDASRLAEAARSKRRDLRRRERAERATKLQADGFGKTRNLPVDLTEENKENLPKLDAMVGGNSSRDNRQRSVVPLARSYRHNEEHGNCVSSQGMVALPQVIQVSSAMSPTASRSIPTPSPEPTPGGPEISISTLSVEPFSVIIAGGYNLKTGHTVAVSHPIAATSHVPTGHKHGFTPANLSAVIGGPLATGELREISRLGNPAAGVYASPLRRHLATLSEAEYTSDDSTKLGQRRRCLECATSSSTKWLKGPTGPATLCDRCGGKYYRQRKTAEKLATVKSVTVPTPENVDVLQPAFDLMNEIDQERLQATSQTSRLREGGVLSLTHLDTPVSRLDTTCSKILVRQHRSVIKSIFPNGVDQVLAYVCPTASLLGGFATSPLMKRPLSVATTPNKSNISESIWKPDAQRKRFMTFNTPPTKPVSKKRNCAENGPVKELDDFSEKGNSENHVRVMSPSEKSAIVVPAATNSLNKSLAANEFELMQTRIEKLHVTTGEHAHAIVSGVFNTHSDVRHHLPSGVVLNDSTIIDQQDLGHVISSSSGISAHPCASPVVRDTLGTATERAVDGEHKHLQTYSDHHANDDDALIHETDETRIHGQDLALQEASSPTTAEPFCELDASDGYQEDQVITSIHMSTQAALLQANEAFYSGLESPDRSISTSTMATPAQATQGNNPSRQPESTGATTQSLCNRNENRLQYQAGTNGPPMCTQDMFNEAPNFDFSTEKKPKNRDRRITFTPSPLVHRSASTTPGLFEDALENGKIDNNNMRRLTGVDEIKPAANFGGSSPEAGSLTTPVQYAQIRTQKSSDSQDVDAMVDDTISFLDSWSGDMGTMQGGFSSV